MVLDKQDTGLLNVGEHRKNNQEWKIQRHWQHWAHKSQDEDNQTKNKANENTKTIQKTTKDYNPDTGSTGQTRHRTNKLWRTPQKQSRMYNPEALTTLGTQVTRRGQKKRKTKQNKKHTNKYKRLQHRPTN